MPLNKKAKYQKKLLISIVLALVLSVLAWKAAFRKTVDLHSQVKQLSTGLNSTTQYQAKKQQLENDLAVLNEQLGMNRKKLAEEEIFKGISNFCKKIDHIRINNFPESHNALFDDYLITTRVIELEGDFHQLLELIYTIENDSDLGRLVSCQYSSQKDYKRKQDILKLKILLQNYELTQNK